MLNVVCIMGRLVADPQIRQTASGKNVTSFSIACDRNFKDANGQTAADFINVVAWNNTADFVCRYFRKGSLIALNGRLQSRKYQDQNGNNRTVIEIVAENVNFAGPRPQSDGQQNAAPAAQQPQPAYSAPAAAPQQPYAAAPQQTYAAPQQPYAAAPAAPVAAPAPDFTAIEDEGDLPF